MRTSISSHPKLYCQGELGFNPEVAARAILNKVKGLSSVRFNKSRKLEITYTSDFPLNYLRSLPDGSGYLVQYKQLDVRTSRDNQTVRSKDIPESDVDLSGFNVIHLVRTNVFERALSCYINSERSRRRSPRGSLRRETKIDLTEKFHIKPEPLKRIIEESKRYIEYWCKKLREDNPKRLTLDYEELYDEQSLTRDWKIDEPDVLMPRPAAEKICNFLEVNYHELRAPLKRMNTPDYENYIENWEEIRDLREIVEMT